MYLIEINNRIRKLRNLYFDDKRNKASAKSQNKPPEFKLPLFDSTLYAGESATFTVAGRKDFPQRAV